MDHEEPSVIFGKRVFVADDNETNLTLMIELLEQDRHLVAIAWSGLQSLEILSSRDFDVLFLDVGMKDIDGVKLLQIFRFGKLDAPPAYLLSAAATAWMSSRIQASGAVGLLQKPVTSREELRHAIARACAREPAADPTLAPVQAPAPGQAQAQAAAPARPQAQTLRIVAAKIIDPWMVEELKSISANPEFLPELLLAAAEDIDRSSDLLMQALRSGDVERTRVTAHALKGVAASVGANRLAAFAARLMREHPEQQGPALKRMCAELAEVSLISMTALLDIVAGLAHPLPGPRPIPRVARVTSVGQVKQQNG